MRARLAVLGIGATLAMPGFALAQAVRVPNGAMNSTITCAPLVQGPAGSASGSPSSSMAEMCTAADPWKDKTTGANKGKPQRVAPTGEKSSLERRPDAGTRKSNRTGIFA